MAQVVYYVTATDHLRGEVNFCVPSGNFGNVFSGWIAKRMGAADRPTGGRLERQRHPHPVLQRQRHEHARSCHRSARRWTSRCRRTSSGCCSRSMGATVGRPPSSCNRFRASGRLSIEADQRAEYIDGVFAAARLDDEETVEVIRRTYASTGECSSTRTQRSPSALPSGRGRRSNGHDRHDGHGAPGQVPRRGRAGDRRPATTTGSPGRSDGTSRAHHPATQRARCRAAVRRSTRQR